MKESKPAISVGHYTGTAVVFIALVSSIMVSMLSAKHVISISKELAFYPKAVAVSAIGIVIFFIFKSSRTKWSGWLSGILTIVMVLSFIAVLMIRLNWNNNIFFFWMGCEKNASTWLAVENEMDKFAAQNESLVTNHDWVGTENGQISPVFNYIGDRNEYAFGNIDAGRDSIEVLIAYGYKSRRWGVYKGDMADIKKRWPNAKIMHVGQNMLYFVASD